MSTKEIKRLQEELVRRTNVEKEAERLICQGEYEAALALLETLDDSVIKKMVEAIKKPEDYVVNESDLD